MRRGKRMKETRKAMKEVDEGIKKKDTIKDELGKDKRKT